MQTNYLKLSLLSISAFLLSANLNTVKAQLNFAPAVDYSTGFSPYSVVSGDFNGDGNLDLATANYGSNNYSVLLNNGNGTYANVVNYNADLAPYSICTADFNEDGNLDLAISNQLGNNISIHNGLGDGTFGFDNDFGVSNGNPLGIVAADFDSDGNMDIVVTTNNYEIVVYFGNGSGFFPSSNNYPVDLDPVNIFAADFNGDGLKDIVTTNLGSDSLSVLLNVGAGSFTTAVNYKVNSVPFSVISADFNGDGKMDLVSANYNTSDVSVLLGNGNGTFTTAVNYVTDSQPTSLTFADFNGDSKLDIATCNADVYNVSILLGSGLGSFATPINFPLNSYPSFIIADDFNGDGKVDLSVASSISDSVAVLLNTTLVPAAALNFDGTGLGNKVILPSAINTVFSNSNKITVEAWVKPSSLTGYGHIVGNYNAPNNQMQFMIRRQINEYGFWIGNSGSYYALNSTSAPTLNTWEHVAMSYNGSILTAYVNGVVTGTLAISYASLGLTTNSLIIGGNNNINENFSGDIDEVRIWNRALCKSEIVHNMNIELPNGQPGLIAYYKFNQGVENSNNTAITSLADSSGNSYDGTLNNFALSGTTSNWIAPGAVTSGGNATAFVSPTVSISGVNSICNGASTTFTATGNVTAYNWLSGPATATNSVSPTGTTTYSVVGTNSLGCLSNTATITLTVNALPSLVASTNNTLLCTGETATLSVMGAATYTWSTTETTTDIAVTPTVQTTYTVEGTDANGCQNTTSITQVVSLCTGINQIVSSTNNVSVYPNPSTGIFVVAGFETGTKLEVVNVIGEVVYKSVTSDTKTKIDLSNQSNGVYFIKTTNGLIHKLIKQ